MSWLTLLRNWKTVGLVAAIAALALFIWNGQRVKANMAEALEYQTDRANFLAKDVQTLAVSNQGKDIEIVRLNEEKNAEIRIVEIAAITRTEQLAVSRKITEELPDEDPMCGPWAAYFNNVLRYTSTARPNGS